MLTKPNMTAVLWFSQFIIIFSLPSLSCFLMAIFSCHFDGHPQFSTFVIPNSFTSTSKVDVSIKYAIVTHLNKQRPDNVVITSVFLVLLWSINMWKPPPPTPSSCELIWPLTSLLCLADNKYMQLRWRTPSWFSPTDSSSDWLGHVCTEATMSE